MILSLLQAVRTVLRDQRGVETLEWVVVGSLIVGVGVLVYPGTLGPVLTAAITAVGAQITAAAA